MFDWLPKSGANGEKSGAVTLFIEGPTDFLGETLDMCPGDRANSRSSSNGQRD